MLSESLRRRLESLNREALPPAPARAAAARVVQSPSPEQATSADLPAPSVIENDLGSHLLYTIPLADLWPAGPRLVAGRLEHLRSASLEGDLGRLVEASRDRAAMLDLETCGFSGSALFLAGLLRWVEGAPTIELLFARHYGEEPAVLVSLWERLGGIDVLGTYNGKSFDWPMVMDRTRRHLLDRRMKLTEPRHVDLLHHARRKWRAALPDCKLQTIERLVCRRRRGPDIPGAQIPAAYDAYVRTGQDAEMRLALHHNSLDLVTLLDIAMRVAG